VDRDSERDGERREKKVREPHLLPVRYSMPAPSSSTLEIRHAALVLCFSSNPMRHRLVRETRGEGRSSGESQREGRERETLREGLINRSRPLKRSNFVN
jgi:hypothetical protein